MSVIDPDASTENSNQSVYVEIGSISAVASAPETDPSKEDANWERGSPLGLAIVKSQIEAMGGRVWVEHNEPGARFVVELDKA